MEHGLQLVHVTTKRGLKLHSDLYCDTTYVCTFLIMQYQQRECLGHYVSYYFQSSETNYLNSSNWKTYIHPSTTSNIALIKLLITPINAIQVLSGED